MKAIHKLYPEAAKTKWKSDTEMYACDKDGNEIELDLDAINNWVDPEAHCHSCHLAVERALCLART